MESATTTTASSGGEPASSTLKRKRSPSLSNPPPPSAPVAKSAKQSSNHLSINYLARSSTDDLPLINKDESLPNLLHLLSLYSNVLDRHESLASNLGARPLGPILIKRFERCFDAAPKILTSPHHKNTTTNNADDNPHHITWLEVIEFARSHPSQFTLSTFSEGRRVCQFYYPQKQLRVQISEEDFLFINSGRCQELIPPLPIWEDEEKEVGTCDVLETKLKELTNAADMVAARTRQLSHRLKGRRTAILERRADGGSGTPAKASAQQTTTAPLAPSHPSPHPRPPTPMSSSSLSGANFTAVNTTNGNGAGDESTLGCSASVRSELLRHFEALPQNQHQSSSQLRHSTVSDCTNHISRQSDTQGHTALDTRGGPASNASSLSPVPPGAFINDDNNNHSDSAAAPKHSSSYAGHRQSASLGSNGLIKHNFSRPLPPALESSQPFRPLCQAHMDGLIRGHRVLPPCDRCRRLKMDCVKNLTSCAGCTKKHARCHWRDVSRDELGALDHLMENGYAIQSLSQDGRGYTNGNGKNNKNIELLGAQESDDEESNPLEDLEALGEQEEREREDGEGEGDFTPMQETARQEWKGSFRPADPLHDVVASNTITSASERLVSDQVNGEHHPAISQHTSSGDLTLSKSQADRALSHDHNNHKTRDVDEYELIPENLSLPVQVSIPVAQAESTGGFRAVNSSYVSVEASGAT